MKQIKHIGVYGLLVKDNKILLIKKCGGPYDGKLDLPGGSIEFNESIEEALIREFKEEVGIDILDYSNYDMVIDSTDMSAEEIANILNEEKKKIIIVALVDTLEYLKKGGRISKAVAFAGGVLNIKPVLSVIDGEINMLGKARGSKMGKNLLVEEINKAGGIDFSKPVLLGYSGISDALLLKYIEDSRHIWEGNLDEVRYTPVGSVIGTHAGPGAVVVAFFKK